MDLYPTSRQQFIEVMVSTLATSSVAMATIECCICNRPYGEPIVKDATAVLFQELPFHDTFMPDTVEQITIPCTHHFCTLCIGKWFYANCTCPMCRQSVDLSDLAEAAADDHLSTQIEGCMQVYEATEWRAREACNIHRLSMRQLPTTPQRMPLVWLPVNMVFNLPRLMVTVGHPVPSDLSTLKLRLDKTDFNGYWISQALNQLARADAPLARHPDAHDLHEFLCYRIAHFMSMRPNEQRRMLDSDETTWVMFYMASSEMPELTGDVARTIWDEYVYCILHALIVWEAYCTRVQILSRPEVADDDIPPAP